MARRVKTRALQVRPMDTPPDGSVPLLFAPRSYDIPIMAAFGIDPATGRPRTRQGTCVWHRGSGKTVVAIAGVIIPAMLHMSGTYFHVFPTYQQAKKAVWDKKFDEGPQIGRPYLDFFRPFALPGTAGFNETELQITFRPVNDQRSGSIYQLVGMDTPRQVDLLRSTGPLGVVYDEYQLMQRYAYDVLAARLAQTKGWVLFIGTPYGEGSLKEMYDYCVATPGCFAEILNVNQTRKDAPGEDGEPVTPPQEVDRLRKSGMSEAFLQQEIYCSWMGYLYDTIFGEALKQTYEENRITQIPYDDRLPVKTVWDLGRDTTAIWFYQVRRDSKFGTMFCFIDYEERKGDEGDIFKIVHLVKEQKIYIYNDHLAPWDLEAIHWGMTESRKDLARKLGIRFRICPKASIEDGISAGRRIFPHCYFDEKKTQLGRDRLAKYRFPYDPQTKTFGPVPVHDENSHAGSAFRYFAMSPHETNDYDGTKVVQAFAKTDFARLGPYRGTPQRAGSLI